MVTFVSTEKNYVLGWILSPTNKTRFGFDLSNSRIINHADRQNHNFKVDKCLKDSLFSKNLNLNAFLLVSVPKRLTTLYSGIWSYWNEVWLCRNQAWFRQSILLNFLYFENYCYIRVYRFYYLKLIFLLFMIF